MYISQTERAYFQERVTFFSNCFTLYNYNLSGDGSYANHQIKSEEASGTLHFASTISVERVFQWPLRLFTEPSTTLDKTVILIEQVCDKIFSETYALGSILTESKEKFKNTVSRYNFLCHLIHGVFRGVKIMNNTYQKHYFTIDPNHAGLGKLFQLATELQNRGDTIMEEYNKVGLSLKKLDQNDVNQFLCDEVTYHDNLYALSKYGTTENAKYRNLQIKSIQDTERLLSTSFWDPFNWTGELTSLDKTAPIIKKVCERTANECIPLLKILSETPKIDNSMKMMFIQDLRSKLELALPGVIRMNNVYREHYFRKRLPEHKGLDDLKNCANNLGWVKSQLYLLNLRFPEKQ